MKMEWMDGFEREMEWMEWINEALRMEIK